MESIEGQLTGGVQLYVDSLVYLALLKLWRIAAATLSELLTADSVSNS